MASNRINRINEEIQKELSSLLRTLSRGQPTHRFWSLGGGGGGGLLLPFFPG